MKFSELPKRYRKLEEGFDENKESSLDIDENCISGRFYWEKTPQGDEFWGECHEATSIEELPPIPYIVREDAPKYWVVKLSSVYIHNTVSSYLNEITDWRSPWLTKANSLDSCYKYGGYDLGEVGLSGTSKHDDLDSFKNNPQLLTFKQFKYYFMGYGKPKSLKTKSELNPEVDTDINNFIHESKPEIEPNNLLKAAFEKVGLNETDKTVALIKDVTDAVREFHNELTQIAADHE